MYERMDTRGPPPLPGLEMFSYKGVRRGTVPLRLVVLQQSCEGELAWQELWMILSMLRPPNQQSWR